MIPDTQEEKDAIELINARFRIADLEVLLDNCKVSNIELEQQLAASQAREQQLRDGVSWILEAVYHRERMLIAVDCRDMLALPTDDSALRAWGAKLLRDCYNKCECLSDLMDVADELEAKP